MNGFFEIQDKITIFADERVSREMLSSFAKGFFPNVEAEILPCESGKIYLGKQNFAELCENDEYAVSVTESGVGITACDEKGLARGFLSMLMLFECVGTAGYRAAVTVRRGDMKIKCRMIHLCIFPETKLEYMHRLIRFCGILQYTHVVLEFWGMLKYDALDVLAWENAYTKDEVKALVDEIRSVGAEPVPMFNHLGHASSCRIIYGKHVVLDRRPELAYLFSPDGWAWSTKCEETWELLRKIRKELYELFEGCRYIHLGCDEAFIYGNGYITADELCGYLSRLTREVETEGKTPIVWGDMMLAKESVNGTEPYFCGAKTEETAKKILDSLSQNTVIADWQYDVRNAPMESTLYFKALGRTVLGCPWMGEKNITAHVATDSDGIMMTTWHTLATGIHNVLICAKKLGVPTYTWSQYAHVHAEAATVMRAASLGYGGYEACGMAPLQTGTSMT